LQPHDARGQTPVLDQIALGIAPFPSQPQPSQQKESVSSPEPPNPDAVRAGAFNGFAGKRYVLFEGTYLETLLINRINGTFSGPVDCLVTTDVYSHDRQHLLIPAGTKVLGEAKKVEALGQQRLAVFFHRLIMPDGYSVGLDQFKALNQNGETALQDKVNHHYAQIFGASLAVGILGGVAEAGTGNTLTNSSFDRVREGFGSSMANSSINILDRFLNILPTVTIREGHRVKVYFSGDLLLPDYTQHAVQPDL
jgi:type IV secretion system protein VirB10